MRAYNKLRLRLRSLLRRDNVEAELGDEIRFHVEYQADVLVANGMSREDARREAVHSLGAVESVKEECREERRMNLLENIAQDLRVGLRMLRRSPGFSILAVLCLTLGIGANAAVFSWIEGILFRPYPLVTHQENLASLTGVARADGENTEISWPDFLDLQRNLTLADAVFGDKITGTTLSIGARAERTIGSIVSANYFDAIGVRPIMGRGFEPGEDVGRDAHPVVVIGYDLWQERFKGDPDIIGKTQRLNGVIHTIVGVAPKGFNGTFVGWAMQFWVPASMEDVFEAGGYKLEDRGARWTEPYIRLKPGVTIAQAQQEASALAARMEQQYPEADRGRGFRVWPLWQTPFNNAGTLLPTLGIMMTVVVFVLLIACANVGNLLLVRSFNRRHEITVRAAVGAGRGRLLQQLLTEGLILSTLGAAGGLLLAYWCRHALVLLFPARNGVRMNLPGNLDWRVLAVSIGVCVVSTLLFGLFPAVQSSRVDLAAALKSEMGGVVGGHGKSWIRSTLVLVQVALSFVLLVATALLLQSLNRIRTANPGFSTHGVITTAVDLRSAGYDAQHARDFNEELLNRVRALPGVQNAAFARVTPLGYGTFSVSPIAVDGYTPPPDQQPTVEYNEVTPDYFATIGIPILSGREFAPGDNETALPVAIINQTMAEKYWPGRSPIGERIQVKGTWRRIVGVAQLSKYENVREAPKPFLYVPQRQANFSGGALNIRTSVPPETMAASLLQAVRSIDPNLGLYEVITMQEELDRSTSPQQAAATLLGVLGALALVLSTIGLYGVMSYAVSQNTRELGLRMAIGAGAADLLRLVMKNGLILTIGGVALGAAAALMLTRLLGDMLYKISPRDPLSFLAALAVMMFAAIAACLVPAWRAARTDPMRALRD
jgi:macrolide transport system ATP-binding/permease protein